MAAEAPKQIAPALREAADISAATARLEELECPVCHEQREDLTNPPCQHMCCLRCFTKAHARKPECPSCRESIPAGVMTSLRVNLGLRDEVRRLVGVVHPKRLVSNLIAALAPGVPMPTLVAAAKAVAVEEAGIIPRNPTMEEALKTAYGTASLSARIAALTAYRVVRHKGGNWLDDALVLVGDACKSNNESQLVGCIVAMRASAEWEEWSSRLSWGSIPSNSVYKKLDAECSSLQLAFGWVKTEGAVTAIESVLSLVSSVLARTVTGVAADARKRIATPCAEVPTSRATVPVKRPATAVPSAPRKSVIAATGTIAGDPQPAGRAPVAGVKRSASKAGLLPVGSSSANVPGRLLPTASKMPTAAIAISDSE